MVGMTATIKPDAKICHIEEQIINDEASGLHLMFYAYPDADGGSRLRVCSDSLPFGNRDFILNREGELGGTGTAPGGCCLTWPKLRTDEEIAEHERYVKSLHRGPEVEDETGN